MHRPALQPLLTTLLRKSEEKQQKNTTAYLIRSSFYYSSSLVLRPFSNSMYSNSGNGISFNDNFFYFVFTGDFFFFQCPCLFMFGVDTKKVQISTGGQMSDM